ncbi:MAG: 30S ribosomal protein S12 methylthiotransferase RimO [Lachnospiraceae bacterium]|nr:30S ribosomal protein S12 methylthiotransferase RimO [Lachnospiraceae bacterium]
MKSKIHFVSLGCDKNLVDSEVMLTKLWEEGHSFTDDENEAEVIVVNTCCFIHDAKMESIEAILRLAEYKKSGRCKALIVTGCLSERYRNEIREEIPEIDAIIGVMAIAEICKAVASLTEDNCNVPCNMPCNEPCDNASCNTASCNNAPCNMPENGLHNSECLSFFDENSDSGETGLKGKRIVTTGGQYAYLKIAEGCDKHCTYCIIPKIRGNYRSVTMEKLLTDSVNLAAGGVTELILVAQETTLYGLDLYGRKMLPELLRKLCEIEGLKWIRLLYCYPEEITDELIEVIRDEPKICNYLDIPIQHGADGILKRMGRKTDRKQIIDLIIKLRREIPDICLRTTLMTGFPGESQADHLESLSLIEEMKFDRLGVFTYSMEEDTPAALMPTQIGQKIMDSRYHELMEKQQEIAFLTEKNMVGKTMKVVVEGRIAEFNNDGESISISELAGNGEEKVFVARTYRDAPEIDGYLFIVNCEKDLISGGFYDVAVTASNHYDLIGEIKE